MSTAFHTASGTGTGKGVRGRVYAFGRDGADGSREDKSILGGKGANLAEMTRIGLPVPPGFTITAATCAEFNENGRRLPAGLMDEVRRQVSRVEAETGREFGSEANPLLVSVRSGAAVSMPGMMDTVLNLGLTDRAVAGLAAGTGNERFAWDAYRRLISMFGDVVMGVEYACFERELDAVKRREKVSEDTEISVAGLRDLCERFKGCFEDETGRGFPQEPLEQMELAIEAVFGSWNKDSAVSYRRINGITGLLGTAVTVQAMVFGNMGDDSATGVAFTRNPSTGENALYGEFLVNAQGEDVVAGIRTPKPISRMKRWNQDAFAQLVAVREKLETHYGDMQDLEFTIERGKLYMLQTRTGKRTGAASVRIAKEMVDAGLLDRATALTRVNAKGITQMLLPHFRDADKKNAEVLCKGLPASPGAASGGLAFTADEAVERAAAGESVILVRKETSPEDVEGMHAAEGILTSTGGMTSHAAVVARGWGKCCVAGAGALSIDAKARTVSVNGKKLKRDTVISIDGATGEVFLGEIPRHVPKKLGGELAEVLGWADEVARMGVRANADTPQDAKRARELGATGIGLCRTEHMFFGEDRIGVMREMILAETVESRRAALKKLLPMQRKDFAGIFKAMDGFPVTVRLLDPPLHEFLPNDAGSQKAVAESLGVKASVVKRRVSQLHESNPMLGHRGCRLAITYPEVLEMQVRAIAEAAISCVTKGVDARPEIMIPLVGVAEELRVLREVTLRVIEDVKRAKKFEGELSISVGTMIEVPRACVTAAEVAEHADFFSFGTNDLTQMTYGYSRDDINSFLPDYLGQGLLASDPFESIDEDGVGALVDLACRRGRGARGDLKLGICGEHGGDPASIRFFDRVGDGGLDYVSCSPFRVPIARLVCGQAVVAAGGAG